MKEKTIEVNGVTLFYKVTGTGKPLLLLHGNGEDHHIFDELTEKMKENFTVYAIDSRNHGQSQKTDDYSYRTMCEDIYHLIQTLNLGQVYLAGFSDGGIIGLMLAMYYEEVLEKAALLGVNLKPEDFTEENYQYIKETYEETKDPLFQLMLTQPNIELDELRDITVPTLLIFAEDDLYKPQIYTDLKNTLLNAKLKSMSGHDHGSYIIHQDILAPDLLHFFAEN